MREEGASTPDGRSVRSREPSASGSLAAIALAASLAVACGDRPPPGSPDPSFGDGGVAVVRLPGASTARGLALQPDGQIAVVGTYFDATAGLDRTVVLRLLRDGRLDPSFARGGVLETEHLTVEADAGAIAVQPDGRIVAVAGADAATAVLRLEPDGRPDPTFGSGGTSFVDAASGASVGQAVALQPGDRPVVTGYVGSRDGTIDVLGFRLTAAGALDPTFQIGGAIPGFDTAATGIVVQPDAKVVVAGPSNPRVPGQSAYFLMRFGAEGGVDPGFAGGNYYDRTMPDDDLLGYALALQPDGKIVVAGSVRSPQGTFLLLARNLPDGPSDDPFGGGLGARAFAVPGRETTGRGVAVLADGRIVAAGAAVDPASPSDASLVLVRAGADGLPDETFGPGGIATYADARFGLTGVGLAVASDGKMLVAGNAVDRASGEPALMVARFLP